MVWESHYQFGRDALGPVMEGYFHRLHAYLCQCERQESVVLFALRAGVRIYDLYEAWLEAKGLEIQPNIRFIKASRMMLIKAVYESRRDIAMAALEKELGHGSLAQYISAVLPKRLYDEIRPELVNEQRETFQEFLDEGNHISEKVSGYLQQQAERFRRYLYDLVGDAERVILVDSGWKGTSQLLLEAGFPDLDWEGIYFGCIGRAEIDGHGVGRMHGLVLDSEEYQPCNPETAFVVHRHLIESFFEPGIESVEHLEPDDAQGVGSVRQMLNSETRVAWDETYDGVAAYLVAHAADPFAQITRDYHIAVDRLAQTLCYPSPDVIPYAAGKERSYDMGMEGQVGVVMPPQNRFRGDTAEHRIDQAIWQTGQAALEYSVDEREFIQRNVLSGYTTIGATEYFVASTDGPGEQGMLGDGCVAIITRTKDRPLLLKRAAESVERQTYENYFWVVVNDGGNLREVLTIARDTVIDPSKIFICSNEHSLGMEAASNVGVNAFDSEYVVIHDDDDSWHPDFLQNTVRFLNNNHKVYDGVITKSLYVSEEVVDNTVVEHGRTPYNDWVQNVEIAEMLTTNFFPPIAFVFRRSIWERISGFDEELPVLGDWDFNIRFLLESDIGVVPKALAYYHHRDQNQTATTYLNSVLGGVDRHAAYSSIVRNKYIRKSVGNSDYAGLAALMGSGLLQRDTRHRIASTTHWMQKSLSHLEDVARQVDADTQSKVDTETLAKLQDELDQRWVALHAAIQPPPSNQRRRHLLRRSHGGGATVAETIKEMVDMGSSGIRAQSFETPPDFDAHEYLRINHDVAEGVERGEIPSAFYHYIKYGRKEGRRRPSRDP